MIIHIGGCVRSMRRSIGIEGHGLTRTNTDRHGRPRTNTDGHGRARPDRDRRRRVKGAMIEGIYLRGDVKARRI